MQTVNKVVDNVGNSLDLCIDDLEMPRFFGGRVLEILFQVKCRTADDTQWIAECLDFFH